MKTMKIKIQKYKKSKIKDFIINSTMVKAEIFWVKDKKIVINKQRRHTKKKSRKFLIF